MFFFFFFWWTAQVCLGNYLRALEMWEIFWEYISTTSGIKNIVWSNLSEFRLIRPWFRFIWIVQFLSRNSLGPNAFSVFVRRSRNNFCQILSRRFDRRIKQKMRGTEYCKIIGGIVGVFRHANSSSVRRFLASSLLPCLKKWRSEVEILRTGRSSFSEFDSRGQSELVRKSTRNLAMGLFSLPLPERNYEWNRILLSRTRTRHRRGAQPSCTPLLDHPGGGALASCVTSCVTSRNIQWQRGKMLRAREAEIVIVWRGDTKRAPHNKLTPCA